MFCGQGIRIDTVKFANGLCEKGARLAALDYDGSRRLGAIMDAVDGDRAVSLLGVRCRPLSTLQLTMTLPSLL